MKSGSDLFKRLTRTWHLKTILPNFFISFVLSIDFELTRLLCIARLLFFGGRRMKMGPGLCTFLPCGVVFCFCGLDVCGVKLFLGDFGL